MDSMTFGILMIVLLASCHLKTLSPIGNLFPIAKIAFNVDFSDPSPAASYAPVRRKKRLEIASFRSYRDSLVEAPPPMIGNDE